LLRLVELESPAGLDTPVEVRPCMDPSAVPEGLRPARIGVPWWLLSVLFGPIGTFLIVVLPKVRFG